MSNENEANVFSSNEEHPNTIEYKRLQAEIEALKQSIISSMERLHFTEEEKKEIIDIIEYHSLLKEAAKVPLIKIDENAILDNVENQVKQNIKLVSDNMVKIVNERIKKIIDRKKN